MPKSPSIPAYADLINCEVIFDGDVIKRDDAIQIYSIEIIKEINTIPRAEIFVVDGWLYEEKQEGGIGYQILEKKMSKIKPGKEVEVKAAYRTDTPETIFKGVITKTGMKLRDGAHSLVKVECADKAIKMTLQRRNEYYLDMTDSDIIAQVVGKYDVSFTPESPTKKVHKEVVQYHSSDWDFILSRADVNGKAITVEDGEIKLMEPTVKSKPVLDLTFGDDFNKANFSLDGASQINSVKCTAWNMNDQKIISSESSEPSDSFQKQCDSSLDGLALSNEFMSEPFELHLTGPIDEKELKEWADARLKKSRLARVLGDVTFQGSSEVSLDNFITLKKTGKYFDGDAYISKIVHTIEEGNWLTDVGLGLGNDWFTESKSNVQTASASGLLPGIEGLYNGVVKKIHDDPDGELRVLVDVPVIKEAGDGIWARMSKYYASNDAGIFFYPEEQDEVVLGFLHNDPRFPIILGSMYSKKRVTPTDTTETQMIPDADNSIKGIVTKNQLKVVFEDKKKNIIIQTPNKNQITLSDEREEIIIIDQHKNTIEMNSKGIKMSSPSGDIVIEGGNITISARQKVDITANSTATMEGKQSVTAKGATATLEGTGTTTVKGGMATNISGGMVKIN